MGLFLLKDGRVAFVGTSTDVDSYEMTCTGRHVEVSTSLELLVRFGMADWERRYLGVTMPSTRDDARVPTASPDIEAPRMTASQKRRSRRRVQRTSTQAKKWEVDPTAGCRQWDTAAWRWNCPLPPVWRSCNTVRVQAAKCPSSACFSRSLASSGATAVGQQCFDPLPGVTVTVTKWRKDRVLLHVWQVDNKSSKAVHFCVQPEEGYSKDDQSISYTAQGPLHTRIEARCCVDVLCVNATPHFSFFEGADAAAAYVAAGDADEGWKKVVWEVVSEEVMRQRGNQQEQQGKTEGKEEEEK
jgi:hypothetical protein